MTTLIAIVGGVSTGKSRVAALLREQGYAVLDADAISHELTRPGSPLVDTLIAQFGDHLRQKDGGLDRRRLRKLLQNPLDRDRLQQLLHPPILQKLLTTAQNLTTQGQSLIFAEIPVFLPEYYPHFTGILEVTADWERRCTRLMARDQLTKAEAEAFMRLQAQVVPAQAHWRVANDGTDGELREALGKTLEQIKQALPLMQ